MDSTEQKSLVTFPKLIWNMAHLSRKSVNSRRLNLVILSEIFKGKEETLPYVRYNRPSGDLDLSGSKVNYGDFSVTTHDGVTHPAFFYGPDDEQYIVDAEVHYDKTQKAWIITENGQIITFDHGRDG